jgi:signal transduction histidine kinase
MSRQVGGTGLGLSIVKDFVDILHGSVEIKEAIEGGASFVVEIPMRAPAGAEIFEQDPNESTSLTVLKRDILEQSQPTANAPIVQSEAKDLSKLPLILIVEDNADLRSFIESSLEEQYRCATAVDGGDAYRQARQLKPDLILTDLMMPLFSGEYLIEKLKGDPDLKNIPIVVLTAKVDEEMQLKLLGQGVVDFIAKPFVTTELLLRVKNHVQSFRAREHLQEELNIKEDNIENLARDVTYKNHELVRLSRLKDEFLATLSHELRTPVSIIHGYAELLIDEVKEDGIAKEAAEAIYRNAKAQLHLVADLVDISKSITGKIVLEPTTVNIKTTFDNLLETARNAAKAKRIDFITEIDPKLKVLWADSVRLTQILWNLVSNAIKFTPQDGEIKISARKMNHDIEFTVTDNGEGIEAGFLPYLFDRFSQQDGSITRKFGGLGLGLSIVKHLVDLHGGSVKVSSPGVGKGATFTVTLPLGELSLSQDTVRQVRKTEALTIDLSGKIVLVVDDEADALSVIALILRKYGVKVLTAKSADEADRVLRDVIPDAIISDIGMPLRNGFEFIRDVRKSATQIRDVPAIALTAFASKQSEQQALQAGFEMYVPKPIESKTLVSMLTRLMQHGHLSTS